MSMTDEQNQVPVGENPAEETVPSVPSEAESSPAAEERPDPLAGIPWLKNMLENPGRDNHRTEDTPAAPEEESAEEPAPQAAAKPDASQVMHTVAHAAREARDQAVQAARQGQDAYRKIRHGATAPVSQLVEEADDGYVPAEPVEVSQPAADRKSRAKRRRTWRELRMERKKVIKTPGYYEGEGKDEAFKINFDFQSEYANPVCNVPIRRSTVKRTGWSGGLMYFAFILCISVAVAASLWMAATDVLALGKEDGLVEVIVPENYTVDDVAEILFSKGLIQYKQLFRLYGQYGHIEDTIDPGTYIVHANFDYRALVYGLSDDGGEQIIVDVTIPEGSSMNEIMAILEEKGVCTSAEFLDAAANVVFEYDFLTEGIGDPYRLEGFLFPDTYEFYQNDDADRVIEKFLDDFAYRFDEELQARAAELGYSVRDVLAVAAIIEEEAGSNDERADIASVIYNRLAEGGIGYLQMDSTVFYAADRMGVEFDTALDSPYNTYVYAGLPGPITNPGLASIRAALYPSETDYMYFAINTDGVSVFFESYDEFLSFTESEEYGG